MHFWRFLSALSTKLAFLPVSFSLSTSNIRLVAWMIIFISGILRLNRLVMLIWILSTGQLHKFQKLNWASTGLPSLSSSPKFSHSKENIPEPTKVFVLIGNPPKIQEAFIFRTWSNNEAFYCEIYWKSTVRSWNYVLCMSHEVKNINPLASPVVTQFWFPRMNFW